MLSKKHDVQKPNDVEGETCTVALSEEKSLVSNSHVVTFLGSDTLIILSLANMIGYWKQKGVRQKQHWKDVMNKVSELAMYL